MAKNHYFVRTETDLFTEPGYDLTLQSTTKVDYHPITNITDRTCPITFIIQGNDSQYIDFGESQLYIRCKITNSKGGDRLITNTDTAPVNNFLHSLFQQVTIQLNDTQITPPSTLYPYKAYLETLLAFGKDYTKTQALVALYNKEEDPSTSGQGWITRESVSNASKTFEMCGKLKSDIFNQNRFLIPGVDVKIVLNRSPDSFCLFSNPPAATTPTTTFDQPQVHIVEAKLIIQKHNLLNSIALSHVKLLDSGHPATYPMRRGDVKSFSLASGTMQYTNENLITGLIPDRLVIGLLTSTSVHGNAIENPFNFLKADVSSISVTVNAEQITSQTFELDFDNKKSIEAYYSIFSGLGIANCDTGLDLTFDHFKNGKTLYFFDLRHQFDGYALPRHGSVKIEIKFRKPSKVSLTAICYCDYQAILCVDKNRHVYFKEDAAG